MYLYIFLYGELCFLLLTSYETESNLANMFYTILLIHCSHCHCQYLIIQLMSFNFIFSCILIITDRLCGLVVRVPGYRFRVLGFDFLHYQIFWEIVSLERGQFSLVITTEVLLGRNSSDSGLENWEFCRVADHATPSIRRNWY
jgi:hypothetical protein